MTTYRLRPALRIAAPQILTGVRVMLAMYAIHLASREQTDVAAALLLFGLATDALDGACARKLGVTTEFGKLLDSFADHLYYVVAPAAISLFLAGSPGTGSVFLLTIPCLFGAMRYSRKAGVSETEFPGIPGSPGLPTLAYALFVIALTFLRREGAIEAGLLAILLTAGAPVFGFLMVARTRFPKLSVYPWIVVPILIGLVILPFALTAPLSLATIVLIGLYVIIGPFLVPQHAAAHTAGSSGTHSAHLAANRPPQ